MFKHAKKKLLLILSIFLISFIFAVTFTDFSDEFSGTTIDATKYLKSETGGLNFSQNNKLILQNTTLNSTIANGFLTTINNFNASQNFTISVDVQLKNTTSSYESGDFYFAGIDINNTLSFFPSCVIGYSDTGDLIVEVVNSSDGSSENIISNTQGNLTFQWNPTTTSLNCSFDNGTSIISAELNDTDFSAEGINQIEIYGELDGVITGAYGYESQMPYVTYAGTEYGSGTGSVKFCPTNVLADCIDFTGTGTDITSINITGADNYSLCLYTDGVDRNVIIGVGDQNTTDCQINYVIGTPTWNFSQTHFFTSNGANNNYTTNASLDYATPEFVYSGVSHNISSEIVDMQALYFWNDTWYTGSSEEGVVYEYYQNWSYKGVFHNIAPTYPQSIYNNGTNFFVLDSTTLPGIYIYNLEWTQINTTKLTEGSGWHAIINNGTNWILYASNDMHYYTLNFVYIGLIDTIIPEGNSIEGAFLSNNSYYIGGAGLNGQSLVYKLDLNRSIVGTFYNLTAQAKGQMQNIINNGTSWFVSAGGFGGNEIDPNVFEYSSEIFTHGLSASLTAPFPPNLTYNSTIQQQSEYYSTFDYLKFYNSSEDKTIPTLSLSYNLTTLTTINVVHSCNDTLSGINTCSVSTPNGTLSNGIISELSCNNNYTITLTATDYAGNSNTTSLSVKTSQCNTGTGGGTNIYKDCYGIVNNSCSLIQSMYICSLDLFQNESSCNLYLLGLQPQNITNVTIPNFFQEKNFIIKRFPNLANVPILRDLNNIWLVSIFFCLIVIGIAVKENKYRWN